MKIFEGKLLCLHHGRGGEPKISKCSFRLYKEYTGAY